MEQAESYWTQKSLFLSPLSPPITAITGLQPKSSSTSKGWKKRAEYQSHMNKSLLLLSLARFPSQVKIKPRLGETKQNQPRACQGHWVDLAKLHGAVVAKKKRKYLTQASYVRFTSATVLYSLCRTGCGKSTTVAFPTVGSRLAEFICRMGSRRPSKKHWATRQ